jgi:aspartate kinase
MGSAGAHMIVMKFGGTSVQDSAAIERAADIVLGRLDQRPVVVVSALAGVTDSTLTMSQSAASGQLSQASDLLQQIRQRHLEVLYALVSGENQISVREQIHELTDALQDMLRGVATLGELSARTTDAILSIGELLSSAIVNAAFQARGIDSVLVDSRRCIVTDAAYTRAVPRFDQTTDRLRYELAPLLQAGQIPVMGGFIAATAEGIPTTLGRGGSDFSAAIIAAALNANRIEIWTDVEGMMTTDPRLCSRAQRIEAIGFDEASELAYFGAKVLHPATLIPAIEKNIPIHVLNSRKPKNQGTRICSSAPPSRTVFRAIAAKKGIQVINVKSPRMLMARGFLGALFNLFERHDCAADLASTSEVSVSIAFDSSREVSPLLHDLKELSEVEAQNGKAIICLVGKQIRGQAGIAAKVFDAIAQGGINVHMISQGASEINISFVVDESDVGEAVRRLHRRFFEVAESCHTADADNRLPAPSLASHLAAQPEVD